MGKRYFLLSAANAKIILTAQEQASKISLVSKASVDVFLILIVSQIMKTICVKMVYVFLLVMKIISF
jgi:hypothetical protein